MPTKKQLSILKKISLLVFFVILFLPQISLGAINTLKPAGAECAATDDEGCLNHECETADDGKYYCTCNDEDDGDCPFTKRIDTGGLNLTGETWDCVNGSDRSRGLNYCLSNKGKVEYAIPPKFGQSATDLATDPSASTVATLDEIKNLISAPQPRITIPGLTFSSQEEVRQAVSQEGDGKYLYIPYFGEYVSAVYRYLVVAISILAVMRILRAGFNWMVFSDQNGITEAKKHIVNAVLGLILILSSYTILYLTNPNFVEFNNLRIKYVERVDIFDKGGSPGYVQGETPKALNSTNFDTLFTAYQPCLSTDWRILKAMAYIESGYRSSIVNSLGFTGLFQTKPKFCVDALKRYNDFSTRCNELTNPEVNTMVGVAMMRNSIEKIKSVCPSVDADSMAYLIYIGHQSGGGSLGKLLTRIKPTCNYTTAREQMVEVWRSNDNFKNDDCSNKKRCSRAKGEEGDNGGNKLIQYAKSLGAENKLYNFNPNLCPLNNKAMAFKTL